MARLHFDADSGCYVGAWLVITGYGMSRRIRLLTEAQTQQEVDPVDAAEAAWNAALEETSWAVGDEGVSSWTRQETTPTGVPH